MPRQPVAQNGITFARFSPTNHPPPACACELSPPLATSESPVEHIVDTLHVDPMLTPLNRTTPVVGHAWEPCYPGDQTHIAVNYLECAVTARGIAKRPLLLNLVSDASK